MKVGRPCYYVGESLQMQKAVFMPVIIFRWLPMSIWTQQCTLLSDHTEVQGYFIQPQYFNDPSAHHVPCKYQDPLHWFVIMPFESTGLTSYYPATNRIGLAKLCPRRYVLLNIYFLAQNLAFVSYFWKFVFIVLTACSNIWELLVFLIYTFLNKTKQKTHSLPGQKHIYLIAFIKG